MTGPRGSTLTGEAFGGFAPSKSLFGAVVGLGAGCQDRELMSSAHLTDEQRAKLVEQLRRQLDYLNRLNTRIVKKRWPLEDPVCRHAILARRALQSLYDAARLSGANDVR